MTKYNYGGGNPMRPHRVRLTTNLVSGYGLTDSMRLLRPQARSREDIMEFHADGEPARGGEAHRSFTTSGCPARTRRRPRRRCPSIPRPAAAAAPAAPASPSVLPPPHPRRQLPAADYVDFLM